MTDTAEDAVVYKEAAGDPVPLPPKPPREAELAGDPVGDPHSEAVRVVLTRGEAVPIPTREVEPESVYELLADPVLKGDVEGCCSEGDTS